jgi:hypothetical protein
VISIASGCTPKVMARPFFASAMVSPPMSGFGEGKAATGTGFLGSGIGSRPGPGPPIGRRRLGTTWLAQAAGARPEIVDGLVGGIIGGATKRWNAETRWFYLAASPFTAPLTASIPQFIQSLIRVLPTSLTLSRGESAS